MIPFGPQLIGQTEKALNALLRTTLIPHDLTEREWVSLRLASQLDGGGDLEAFLADRLHDPDTVRLLAGLRHRGLVAGSALTPAGTALVAEIGGQIADLTLPLWEGLDEHDVEAAERVLNLVLEKSRLLLGTSTA